MPKPGKVGLRVNPPKGVGTKPRASPSWEPSLETLQREPSARAQGADDECTTTYPLPG
jgi:hypothetical protein